MLLNDILLIFELFADVLRTATERWLFIEFDVIVKLDIFIFLIVALFRLENKAYSQVFVSSFKLHVLRVRFDRIYPLPLIVPLKVLVASIKEKSRPSKFILFSIS